MNCKEVKSLLSEFCDKELNQEKSEALKKHVVSCSECRNEYDSISKMRKVLKKLKTYDIPHDCLKRMKNAKKGKIPSVHKKSSNS
jgi:anti-sigma factor (TIGR02949 family)